MYFIYAVINPFLYGGGCLMKGMAESRFIDTA